MNDYKKFLNEIDLTENQVQILVNLDNVIEVKHPNYHKENSDIHGVGVFASKDIKKGETIGEVTINKGYRTVLGRWVNHCKNKNTRFYHTNNGLTAIAEKNIPCNEEILIDYRDHSKNIPFKKILHELKSCELNPNHNPKPINLKTKTNY